MANWHNDNPIMTTEDPVSMDDLIAKFTLNGTADIRRFDLRIDSDGGIWSRLGVNDRSRDGTVEYSDKRRDFDLYKGNVSDYYRNYFGTIVRRDGEE